MKKYSDSQEQTMNTFSFKWGKTDTYSSEHMMNDSRKWLMEKYFDNDEGWLQSIFADGKVVLDAGCGASMSAIALLGERLKHIEYIGVDISDAIKEAQLSFEKRGYGDNHRFIQCDLNSIHIEKK